MTTGADLSAVDSDRVLDGALRGAVRRWSIVAASAVVLFAVVYVVAVWTPGMQEFEDAALRGALQVDAEALTTADNGLGTITVASLAVACVVLAIVGWIRGGWCMAAIVAGIVVVGLGVAEVLKRWVLPRPELIVDGSTFNTFPSGHTTIAMTVVVATLVVVPWRWRGLVMFFVMWWGVGIGSLTVTARWHRLSDTLGGDLIALAAGSLAALLLVRAGMVAPVEGARPRLRVVFVAVFAGLATVAAVCGIVLVIAFLAREAIADISAEEWDWYAYNGALMLSAACSIAVALVAWWTWRRLETTRAPRI